MFVTLLIPTYFAYDFPSICLFIRYELYFAEKTKELNLPETREFFVLLIFCSSHSISEFLSEFYYPFSIWLSVSLFVFVLFICLILDSLHPKMFNSSHILDLEYIFCKLLTWYLHAHVY